MQITPIASISAATAAASTAAAATAAAAQTSTATTADNNQFMTMLLAQLKNQSPLSPMDDKDMMSQMTQLNSLQELQSMSLVMTQISQASQSTYAASLIGKTVKVALDNGDTKEGLVTGSAVVSGAMTIQMGDQEYPIGTVVEVKASQA